MLSKDKRSGHPGIEPIGYGCSDVEPGDRVAHVGVKQSRSEATISGSILDSRFGEIVFPVREVHGPFGGQSFSIGIAADALQMTIWDATASYIGMQKWCLEYLG